MKNLLLSIKAWRLKKLAAQLELNREKHAANSPQRSAPTRVRGVWVTTGLYTAHMPPPQVFGPTAPTASPTTESQSRNSVQENKK